MSTSAPSVLAEHFGVDEVAVPEEREPDYNVTPRREILTVVERGEHRRLEVMRWGMVPSWAKDLSVGDRMINARAETIRDKPAYRRAFAKRRCLIPADGFYEWKKLPAEPGTKKAPKQPMYVHARSGEPLALAGVWEVWHDKSQADEPAVRSCAIVTTSANSMMEPIHDRMPVVLPRRAWDAWLDPDAPDLDDLQSLLVPIADDALDAYPVSTLVNNPKHNGAELLRRVEPR